MESTEKEQLSEREQLKERIQRADFKLDELAKKIVEIKERVSKRILLEHEAKQRSNN